MEINKTRREFLSFSSAFGASLILSGCGSGEKAGSAGQAKSPKAGEAKGGEVTAAEDLMREHGVLRRALLVYSAAAPRLRVERPKVPLDALRKTASLFRSFGEEYHEKMLEEAYIFPAVKQAGGPAALYPDILIAQHRRGREITEYILTVTKRKRLDAGLAKTFARTLDSFVLMYRNHAAREDTIVFPAWKQTLTAQQLDEMGDKFEQIEQQQFGAGGFENAAKQIGEIEDLMGLSDLARFTSAPPPKL